MSAGRRGKAGGGWRPGPKPGSKAYRWSRSPEFRVIADLALARYNANRWRLPRCGAKAKGTGEPCRALPLANGRCRHHGGLTPRGDDWHRLRKPKPGEAGGVEKFDRKLVAQEKALAERKRRLAEASPAVRERDAHWQASHKAGKASERAYSRQQRETGRMIAEVLAKHQALPGGPGTSAEDDVFA